jgi:hypothetical protein
LIACFSQDFKANLLSGMLGKQFVQLQETATKAVDALKPTPLTNLIDDAGLKGNNACQPTVSVALTADSKDLAAIHQSILIRAEVDAKGNLVSLTGGGALRSSSVGTSVSMESTNDIPNGCTSSVTSDQRPVPTRLLISSCPTCG